MKEVDSQLVRKELYEFAQGSFIESIKETLASDIVDLDKARGWYWILRAAEQMKPGLIDEKAAVILGLARSNDRHRHLAAFGILSYAVQARVSLSREKVFQVFSVKWISQYFVELKADCRR